MSHTRYIAAQAWYMDPESQRYTKYLLRISPVRKDSQLILEYVECIETIPSIPI